MQQLVYVLFLAVFSLDALNRYGAVERYVTWLPDVISVVALIAVVLYGARSRSITLGIGYLVVFLLLAVDIVLGAVLNGVSPQAMLTGLRAYFKYLPFFLLPVVYLFSERDLTQQLRFLLWLAMLQMPVAAYQRFVESSGIASGDLVGGTVGTSGHLSVFLICAASVWLAFYLRSERKQLALFLAVLAILLFPTTLNATKGTILLAPIALIVPALIDRNSTAHIRRVAASAAVVLAFVAVFIPVHDHYVSQRWNYGLVEFYTAEGRVQNYLIRSESADAEKAGKIGGIVVAANELAPDPAKFSFGLGIGNVSRSFFGDEFSGAYYQRYGGLGGATVASLAWELGWIGVALVFLLCFMILRDALYLRGREGVVGVIGLGWCGVTLVMIATMFYKNVINNDVLSYLFWFYSGYIASAAARARWAPGERGDGDSGGRSKEPPLERQGGASTAS